MIKRQSSDSAMPAPRLARDSAIASWRAGGRARLGQHGAMRIHVSVARTPHLANHLTRMGFVILDELPLPNFSQLSERLCLGVIDGRNGFLGLADDNTDGRHLASRCEVWSRSC
jgi:hypothetical protein